MVTSDQAGGFSRIELARKTLMGAAVLLLVSLLTAAAALGVQRIEAFLAEPLVMVAVAAVFMIVGQFAFFYMTTNDPFWPLRKRLWKTGSMWVALKDSEDRLEPFVWDRRPLPRGTELPDDAI